jgi:hypothetical protein
MKISRQIGWSQESNLIYQIIQKTERLNQILPGNQASYGSRRVSQMIGWSNESKLYYEWLRSLNKLTQHLGCPDCTTTTTSTTSTTTTIPPVVDSMMTINVSGNEIFFDIPYIETDFGCWINMTNDVGFPRIFSFGQYPSASQAISIENDTFYYWYNGFPVIIYSLTSYIGNWVWISIIGGNGGNVSLWINGTEVGNAVVLGQVPMSSTLYIGSENAPNTYLNGLVAGMIFHQGGTIDLRPIPTGPFTPNANTVLLLGQGGDLTSQTTDQGVFGFTVTPSNITYSANSPYSPANGGSLKFGA